ncbi:C4-dicarboxylate ABC transporter permease [Thermotoga sp. Ku-13t]|uniref:TRAP transporter permease n=1 Tax=Thermotoga sp. Ku-13t TaxID=1755813 RepID=UPI0013EB70FA|nr:TRAP transporter permease [Thermotoga sp. Ku-13t]KAF2958581.1 C4-dicarboxylate ABC transporter permease [Thermotoga sp. Ku-13t]
MRKLHGTTYYFAFFSLVAMAIFHIYTAVFGTFEAYLQRNIHLAFALPLAFIFYPATKNSPKDRVPWYDWLLAVLALLPGLYAIVNYETIIYRMVQVEEVTPVQILLGTILVIMILEATRRIVGLALTILAAASVFYMYIGHLLPGEFKGMHVTYDRIIEHLYLTGEGIFSTPLGVSATFVMIFLILGGFLEHSGVGEYFMDLSKALAGKAVGGPAKIAVVSSGLFGSISGSAVANVYATGTFTIPMMKQLGFSPVFAGAVEAVASSGGQIMPPIMGAAAFIMASFLGIPYKQVMIAALVPAILYYFYVFMSVHVRAVKRGLKGLPDEMIPSAKYVLKKLYVFAPIVVLVIMIMKGYTPMRSALTALIVSWLVSLLDDRYRMGPKRILNALYDGSKNVFVVAIACAAAGIVVGAVTLTGIGFKLVSFIFSLAQNIPFLALIMVMLMAIVLGMGLPTTAAYIVASALAVPALINLGFNPLASHMFVFYYAVFSAITPPVALAAYAASSISGAKPSDTGYQAFRLGMIAMIIPFAFMYDTSFLLQSNWLNNLFATLAGLVSAMALSYAIEGYFETKLTLMMRSLLAVLGVLVLFPVLWLRIVCILAFVLVYAMFTIKKA